MYNDVKIIAKGKTKSVHLGQLHKTKFFPRIETNFDAVQSGSRLARQTQMVQYGHSHKLVPLFVSQEVTQRNFNQRVTITTKSN